MKYSTRLLLAIVIVISVANVSCGKSNYQKHCMCPVYRR